MMAASLAQEVCVDDFDGARLCMFMPPHCPEQPYATAAKVCANLQGIVCERAQLLSMPDFSNLSAALPCWFGTVATPKRVWTSSPCSKSHIASRIDGQEASCYPLPSDRLLFPCCRTSGVVNAPTAQPHAMRAPVASSKAPVATTPKPSPKTDKPAMSQAPTRRPVSSTTTSSPTRDTASTAAPGTPTTQGPTIAPTTAGPTVAPTAVNVVLFILDDSRPDFAAAYASKGASTPNLDILANDARSVIFTRMFASFPECAPSRTSAFFGRTPQRTGILNNVGNTRGAPGSSAWRTMFQLFKDRGYVTLGGGKVFHPLVEDPASWTTVYAPNVLASGQWPAADACIGDAHAHMLNKYASKRMVCVTTSRSRIPDYVTAGNAIATLKTLLADPNHPPFFLAAGFAKPHTPLHVYAPFIKRFGNGVYPYDSSDLASPLMQPEALYANLPYYNRWVDLLSIPNNSPGYVATPNFTTTEFRISAHAAYDAALSQSDDAMGEVMAFLEKQPGLLDNTLIIAMADHGYFLGEHGIWAKDNLFDLGSRVPLIVKVPWVLNARGPTRINHVVELIDLYRTVAGLAGFATQVAADVNGSDWSGNVLAALASGTDAELTWPADSGRAFAQIVRCGSMDCELANLNKRVILQGYTVRTAQWRYSLWVSSNGLVPDWTSVVAEELFDHTRDATPNTADEAFNLILNASSRLVADSLKHQVLARFGSG